MSNFGVSIILTAVNRTTAPIRAVTDNFRELKVAVQQSRGAFDYAAKLGQGAQAVQGFADKTRGLVEAPVKVATSFEQAMQNVAAHTETAGKPIEDLKNLAKQSAQTTRYSALESAQGMDQLASAGLSAKDILAGLPAVLSLAATDSMDLSRASTIAADTMNAFGLEAKDIGHVADVIAMAGVKSSTSVTSIGESMGYAASNAHMLGISLEEVAASALVLSIARKGSRAGTGISEIITRLGAPHAEGLKAFKAIHVNPTDGKGNLRAMPEVMADIYNKVSKMGSANRTKVMHAIFGQDAMDAAAVVMEKAANGTLQSWIKSLTTAQGFASTMANKMTNTTEGAGKKMAGAMEVLNISLGNRLLPKVKEYTDALTANIVKVTAWSEAHPKLTTAVLVTTFTVAGLATVLAGTMVVLATMASALGVLAISMGSSKTGAQVLGGAIKGIGRAFVSAVLWMRATAVSAWAVTVSFVRLGVAMAGQALSSAAGFAVAAARLTYQLVILSGVAVARVVVSLGQFAASVAVNAVPATWAFIVGLARLGLMLTYTAVVGVAGLVLSVGRLGAAIYTNAIPATISFITYLAALGVALVSTAVTGTWAFILSLRALSVSLLTSVAQAMAGFAIRLFAVSVALIANAVPATIAFVGALLSLAATAGGAVVLSLQLFAAALLATPFGWILLAAGAVVGVVALVVTAWTPLKGFFASLWEGIAYTFTGGASAINGAMKAIEPKSGRYYKDGASGTNMSSVESPGFSSGVSVANGPTVSGPQASFSAPQTSSFSEAVPVATSTVSASAPGAAGAPDMAALAAQMPPEMKAAFDALPADVRKQIEAMQPPAGAGALGPAKGSLTDAMPAQLVKFDGELKIVIDSEGRARVAGLRSSNGFKVTVDTGSSMSGAQ